MRLLSFCAAISAVAVATSAGATSRDIETSWGKPGVTLDEYQADASICAHAALKLNVRGHPATKQLIRASRALDYDMVGRLPPGAGGYAGIGPDSNWVRHVYRVDQSFYQIKDMMVEVLKGCLAGQGYREFTLTDEQRAKLSKLALGSEQRRSYLHSLASDPGILARQGI